jgi:hypothetical protein
MIVWTIYYDSVIFITFLVYLILIFVLQYLEQIHK